MIIAQAVAAVEFGRILPGLDQRAVDAGVDGHVAVHDFEDGEDVGVDLADVDIAGEGGDGEDVRGRVLQGEHDGLGVIDAGVCVR